MWFNVEFRRVYLDKLEAYHLWQRNHSQLTWNQFTRLRAVAQEVYASAEREYNNSVKETLLGTLQFYKWWSTLKSALFGVEGTVPLLLKLGGSLTHCPKDKSTLFGDVFDSKQSNGKLTMPQSCFPVPKLTTLVFRSWEIRSLLLDLDDYGSAGPDGIFPLFFIKAAQYLAIKISVIFHKLIRASRFSLCWRNYNMILVPKAGNADTCPSNYHQISITPVLSKFLNVY